MRRPSLDETTEWEVVDAVGFGAALYQAAASCNNSLSVAVQKFDILLGTLPEYSVCDTMSVDSLRVFPIQNFADDFSQPDVEELQLEDGLGFDRALDAALNAKLNSLTETTASLEIFQKMVLLVDTRFAMSRTHLTSTTFGNRRFPQWTTRKQLPLKPQLSSDLAQC